MKRQIVFSRYIQEQHSTKHRTDHLGCARTSSRNVESRCFPQVCRITQARFSPLQALRSSLNNPRILIRGCPKTANTTLSPPTCRLKPRVPGIQKYTSPPKNSDTSCSDLQIPVFSGQPRPLLHQSCPTGPEEPELMMLVPLP